MAIISSPDISAGALSLLCDCVGGHAGQRLLLVVEPDGSDFYDAEAPGQTADAARALGMDVTVKVVEGEINDEQDIGRLTETVKGFDHVIYFSRIGDQIRFSDNGSMPSSTMCYALNTNALNSAFGTACHHGLCEIKDAIDDAFARASHIRVTCPRGTDYSGTPDWQTSPAKEVSVKRFPMLVPQPIPATGFSGTVALCRFLVGTGSRFYEPYYLPLEADVLARVENNSITKFEGKPEEVQRVNQHYLHVAQHFSISPWYVHSWHPGIHPGCDFNHNALVDLLRWSGSAFGNPRLLHFHTCGEYAPGEISWNIVDPTIYIDDVAVWENGCLHPERLDTCAGILTQHPNLASLYAHPHTEIGLAG